MMIIIDGKNSDLKVENFSNLEEILTTAANENRMENRIVTDVILNNESFSELYPHQAEDIDSDEIESLEIRSVPVGEMALNIASELHKVNEMINGASRHIAQLFRQADNDEALELFQDLLDVTRDFLAMMGYLQSDFVKNNPEFKNSIEQLSELLGEMTEVLESEDWILLADLLEYELAPASENWKQVIQDLREDIRKNQAA